ncbi:peptidoglycan bridge formation glycyltransferase FemA/FemB family protein [Candidatus Wolfebacteria bacterium]|nr:peptidoglycan bridge formation glycyltransferase FemA/FemB family protein [Candidatus Wolfebacteria bacterium]
MEIREIKDKKIWEEFVAARKPHTFLQSWNWGEFNAAMGEKIWRLGIYEQSANGESPIGNLVGAALIVKVAARRGTFLFVPHGPVFIEHGTWGMGHGLKTFVDYLKELAHQEQCRFIRISPILVKNKRSENSFKELGFRQAPIHMHAELLWMLDIAPGEEKLLKDMRKTTRYLIKKAQADGVTVIATNDPRHILIFNNLYESTAERQHFKAFSRDYLEKEFGAFAPENQIQVFLAEYHGEFIAGAMVVFYGNAAFYHQGASLNTFKKIPAPYLLQWEIIREAKRRGMEIYNFWGIAPDDKPAHPWAGLSLFKKGFGGSAEELLPAQDLVLSKRYWFTYGIERLRKIKRGL